MKIKSIITSLALILSAQANAVDIVSQRCSQLNSINTRSMSVEQALTFLTWLNHCKPEFGAEIDSRHMAKVDGEDRYFYPVLAQEVKVPDSTTFSGYRTEFQNPANYVPPFDQILSKPRDQVHAVTCNIPEGYVIAGWCRASCFTPDQKLAYMGADVAVADALDQELMTMVTLHPETTLDAVQNGRPTYVHTDIFTGLIDRSVR